ncbi:MAG: hypothetical protein KAH57_04415 [Thermoplasmata archaeon]|nr:hypothetical protein [Thermoplasmata archaeon]
MMEWIFWVYIALGIAGLAVLLVMMIFGGLDFGFDGVDIDMGDIDFDLGDMDAGGGVGLPLLLSFISAFGWFGAILTYMKVNIVLTPIISIGAALGISLILFLLTRYFLKHFSSDSTVRFRSLIGKSGSVSVVIRPGEEGQIVVFTEQRGRTIVPAVSDKRIPTNAEVVIIGKIGDAVKVMGKREWELQRAKSKRKGDRPERKDKN